MYKKHLTRFMPIHNFKMKALRKLGIKEKFLDLMKNNYDVSKQTSG